MSKRIDRVGERHGRLVVKRFIGTNKYWVGIWECVCDCGNIINVLYSNLHSGTTKSCGCLKNDILIQRSTKHGLSGGAGKATRLYRIWLHMRRRCLSKKSQDYQYYGGRGITICNEWNEYEVFHSWAMASGYGKDLTIERINNNGNYEPYNCRWATRKEQARNTRGNRLITYNGMTKVLSEWAEYLGIPNIALRMRFHRGWSVEKALTAPIKNKSNSEVM